ncbi:MAG: methyltransferase, partial [Gammaproteobacteria bacterium]|nr:methyltransferase [Gammaproteobacteria bacterium]
HSIASASELLLENIALFDSTIGDHGVLDLACGNGRNGLLLLQNNIAVIFADNNRAALDEVECSAELLKRENSLTASYEAWEVDLEQEGTNPLDGKHYGAVLVFNYLHRPLLPAIKQVITQAGLIFYETFTVHQPKFGRPLNPDYLLKENELLDAFEGWEVIDYFEGVKPDPERAVASLIARKQSPDG